MNAEMLQLIGNMVSVIADAMTLIGLGGILTWGFVRKGSSRFADRIVDVFFFSIRLFLLFPITLIRSHSSSYSWARSRTYSRI